MTQQPINLGVIGMGPENMASTFSLLKDVQDLRYNLQGICTRRQGVLDECLKKFNVSFGSTDYRELVKRDDIDVVCVFSPDHLHAEHCFAALEAGKHVVCTMPMVTLLEDARKLVVLAREKKLKFMVGETIRFDRQFLSAKKLFDKGDLGDLIALEGYYVHDLRPVYKLTPWRLSVPQDEMFGGCIHCIDIISAFGGDIDNVHANAIEDKITKEYPIENNFFINIKFKSGVIGRVSGLYGIVHPPMPMMQFGVYGTKGSLQSDFTDNEPSNIRVVLDSDPQHKAQVTEFETERDLSTTGDGAAIIRYMRHFQDCLDNDREPCPGVLDGAKAIAAGVAAWESIKTGKVVKACNEF